MPTTDACPKCTTPRERAEHRGACRTCGLRVDLWPTFDNRPAPHAILDPAFDALQQRFDDPAAHDTFIALARSQAQLDAAAARYRAKAGDHPQIARALAQIAFIAAQENEAAGRLSQRSPRSLKIAATVVAFFLFCVVGVLLGRLLGKGFRR